MPPKERASPCGPHSFSSNLTLYVKLTKIRVQNSTPEYFLLKNCLWGSVVVSVGHLPLSLHAQRLLGTMVWAAPHLVIGMAGNDMDQINPLIVVPPSPGRDSLPCPGRDSAGSDLESHLDEAEFKMPRDAFDHCLLTMDLHVVTGSQTRRKLENFSAKMSRDAKMCH